MTRRSATRSGTERGARLKALDLYNAESLPTIDRGHFETDNLLPSEHFYFEVYQISDCESDEVRRLVGVL